jgi:hypothetical protein
LSRCRPFATNDVRLVVLPVPPQSQQKKKTNNTPRKQQEERYPPRSAPWPRQAGQAQQTKEKQTNQTKQNKPPLPPVSQPSSAPTNLGRATTAALTAVAVDGLSPPAARPASPPQQPRTEPHCVCVCVCVWLAGARSATLVPCAVDVDVARAGVGSPDS